MGYVMAAVRVREIGERVPEQGQRVAYYPEIDVLAIYSTLRSQIAGQL